MNIADTASIGALIAMLICMVGCLAAWVTHVITCISTASYIFLVAGAICAPIGAIHGFGIWLGIW